MGDIQVLTIGDLHFKTKNLELMSLVCQEILNLLDLRTPELCVILGDTLDTHERLHIRPVTAASKFILECAKRCHIILLIGNHDRENNSDFQTDIHPFNALKEHPRITVVDHCIWDEKYNFIYTPYVPPGRFRDALATAGWTLSGPQPDLGFSHQEFKGAADGSHVSEHGDSWSSDLYQQISGHYHGYQVLPGVCYVGTPIQHRFGDSPDNALLMIHFSNITGEGKDRRSTKTYERIPILSVPKRIVLHFDKNDLDDFSSKIPPGYQVKVFLVVDGNETAAIQKDPRYLALLAAVDSVAIKTNNEKMSLASQAMEEMKVQDRMSLEEVVDKMLEDDPETRHIFQSEIAV